MADILDVRDLIARYEDLTGEYSDLTDAVDEARTDLAEAEGVGDENEEEIASCREALEEAEQELADWDGHDELSALSTLLDELKGYGGEHQWQGDWYPVTLIEEGYFTEYAQELAEDMGSVNRDAPWPQTFIDWDAAAEALKMDYSEVEYDGMTYYYRA